MPRARRKTGRGCSERRRDRILPIEVSLDKCMFSGPVFFSLVSIAGDIELPKEEDITIVQTLKANTCNVPL